MSNKKQFGFDSPPPKVEGNKTERKLVPEIKHTPDQGKDTYQGIPGDGVVSG